MKSKYIADFKPEEIEFLHGQIHRRKMGQQNIMDILLGDIRERPTEEMESGGRRDGFIERCRKERC